MILLPASVPPTSVETGLPPVPTAPPVFPATGGAPGGVLLFLAVAFVCVGAALKVGDR